MRLRHLLLTSLVVPFAPVMAQDQITDAEATTSEPPQQIVVTGTRRTDRTVLESSAPVDVFSAEDFKAQPAPQLQTILQTLVPSFNQQRNLLGDASAFIRPPTLRGLPADQILVLLNGKRVHRSALVQLQGGALNAGAQGADLSQISSAAVGRVEVLRDGAAAQYGSDAIAGVINIGLRRDTGYQVTARYGQSYAGDGEDTQMTAFYGTELGDNGGFFNATFEFIDQNVFDRSVERPAIAPLRVLGITPDRPTGNRLGGPENRAYRATVNTEIPAGDALFYAFANYGYQRQGNDFNYRSPRTVNHLPIPGRPNSGSTTRAVPINYLTQIGFDAQGKPRWDINGATFDIFNDSRFPELSNGFIPFFEQTNEDIGIVGGFKGDMSGINYDFSMMYGVNQVRYFMSDTINASLGPNTPTDFYMGKFVQREFNFNGDFNTEVEVGFAEPLFIAWGVEVRREAFEVGLGDTPSWTIGPFASQNLFQCTLAGAPVACSTTGASAPTFVRTQVALPGSNGFQGFGPASVIEGGRNNYSGYIDFESTPVTGLDVGIAARYDYFDDFGDTFNGKISARWEMSEAIAVRATASTGFRAPTPGQQFTQNLTTGFPFNSTVPLGTLVARPDSAIGQFYLAESLTPEKSVSLSGGVVIQPGGGFNVTIDYYNIKVTDRIGISGAINPNVVNPGGGTDAQFLLSQGIAEAAELGSVRYFTNAFDTRTQGFDVVVSHDTDTSIGRFRSNLALNYNKTDVTDRKVINGTLASGRVLSNFQPVDDVRAGNIEESVPRWRAVLSTSYTQGIVDAVARVNYFGSFTSFFDPITQNTAGTAIGPTPTAGNINTLAEAQALYPVPFTKKFGAQASFDIEVGLTFAEKYRIAVGAQNLFDTLPERETRNIFAGTGGAANGSIYNDNSPIGWLGGFWYARVTASF